MAIVLATFVAGLSAVQVPDGDARGNQLVRKQVTETVLANRAADRLHTCAEFSQKPADPPSQSSGPFSSFDDFTETLTTLFPVWVRTAPRGHSTYVSLCLPVTFTVLLAFSVVTASGVPRCYAWHHQTSVSSMVQARALHRLLGVFDAFNGPHADSGQLQRGMRVATPPGISCTSDNPTHCKSHPCLSSSTGDNADHQYADWTVLETARAHSIRLCSAVRCQAISWLPDIQGKSLTTLCQSSAPLTRCFSVHVLQALGLSPALATGLILVSCCPGGQVRDTVILYSCTLNLHP